MGKTALEMNVSEWRKYRLSEALREREQGEHKRAAQQKAEAWDLARRAARLLREEYGAKRVVIFGSLAHGQWLTPWSDIDLAAWGIPPTRFYAAVAAIAGMGCSFKIDLIDVETCRPSLKRMIEQEGMEL